MPEVSSIADLAALRRYVQRLERPAVTAAEVVAFGLDTLDGALPWGGLVAGGLHEIAGPPGDAARFGFAAALLARATRAGRPVLWCRCRRGEMETGVPYGPGLAGFGLSPSRLILVEAERPTDVLWAAEEGLRSGGLAAVLAEEAAPDLTVSRRLQLAAAAGRSLALALPPAATTAERRASAALTRWHVAATPSRDWGLACWQVELRHCRGGIPRTWCLEWDNACFGFRPAATTAGTFLRMAP